ncbi:hypothetical protein CIL05_03530 [Virgibacillus profundi]|uniref:Uncharacterized protein n=1 Tax=Virgibacillus profundi TaxID=2024555 RepID=A0A2A2II75_9BACI|nr:hypothetical protein CIL05_03530 [Virgibacillus profundi]PXY54986.1 hypothetical protein CIT14_03610 [Virgibacillus profundi]
MGEDAAKLRDNPVKLRDRTVMLRETWLFYSYVSQMTDVSQLSAAISQLLSNALSICYKK